MNKFVACIMSMILYAHSGWGQTADVNVEIDINTKILTSTYRAGVTHTQYSIDSWANAQANANAKLLLSSSCAFQNQHIMGWGAQNPWPDSTVTNPKNWAWESLDYRIQLMRETKGIPVITLCACPTWMHTPSLNGQSDWNAIGSAAPTKSHYDDFAHLCAEVARRYPDVLYFQVWNEFKGFYNATANRWDYENYTRMYNMVYDSLKSVNPKVMIGGPYVVMDSWSTNAISNPSNIKGDYGIIDQRDLDVIKYWLANKKGAEFINIDGGNDNKDGKWITDGFKASQKFVDVINWIRLQPGGESIPVWWAEWYAWTGITSPLDSKQINAVMADGMLKSISAGYSNLILWQPQGDALGYSFPMGIWTNTDKAGGGQPTLYYKTQKGLNDYFNNGKVIYKSTSSPENSISVMATDSTILLVNHLNQQVKVNIKGKSGQLTLNPYEVRFLFFVDIATLVENNMKTNDYSVYPNPFTDQLNIRLKQNTTGDILIELFDLSGIRVLFKECKYLADREDHVNIKTVDLIKGAYLLNVWNNTSFISKLVVKN